MKRVILIRHAKTISYGYDQDFDRTLTDRGIDNAQRISLELKSMGLHADLMIASPAVRTTHTARIFAETLGYPREQIRYEKKLYSGKTAENFLIMLQEIEEDRETVFVVGHNPTVYYYLHYLLDDFTLDVPTCSTVGIEFSVDRWEDLAPHQGELIFRLIPDMFD